jgi:hypothetical protein
MPVSGAQRRLARRLGGELNFRVGRRCIDVAVDREGVRIAVEFDSWYFHGGQQHQDEERDRDFIALGWRVLRVRSAYQLPSAHELKAALDRLVAGEDRVIITLAGWGVGPARGVAYERDHPPRPYRRRKAVANA